MQYTEATRRVAKELNLNEQLVANIYSAYCKLIVNRLSKAVLKDTNYTEEEFNELGLNINLPSLGKIYCTYQDYCNHIKSMQYVQKSKEN